MRRPVAVKANVMVVREDLAASSRPQGFHSHSSWAAIVRLGACWGPRGRRRCKLPCGLGAWLRSHPVDRTLQRSRLDARSRRRGIWLRGWRDTSNQRGFILRDALWVAAPAVGARIFGPAPGFTLRRVAASAAAGEAGAADLPEIW